MHVSHSKTFLAFGDMHIPYHNEGVIEIVHRVGDLVQPDLIVTLGDLLDCSQFSVHPPTFGMRETEYISDLETCNEFLDRLQEKCKRLAMVEGNHEYRIDRWAARAVEGRGAYTMLAPRLQLLKKRASCTYIPYGSVDGRYPHYAFNNRLIAVHGWSYAHNATKQHLQISQGKSVIHGHTHRADTSIIQNIWSNRRIVQASSAGCLCKPVPLYGTGRPVEWVNSLILGYLGRRSDTWYTIPILDGRCILPDGTEITAGEEVTK